MKIAIDISAVIYGTGVSVYTTNLINSLLKVGKGNEFVLFGGSLRRGNELKNFLKPLNSKFVETKVFPLPPTIADFIWNRVHRLSIEKLIGKVDVFHSSDWSQPPSKAFKVTTIHDLTPILNPEWSHSKIVLAHKARFEWIKKEVDRIIVPSKTTASDCEKLGIEVSKIRVIPEAVDILFKKSTPSEIKQTKMKYKIAKNYILSVGVNKRKNTSKIIESYKKISNNDINLVIVGHPYENAFREKGVIYTGYVSKSELASLYSGALALVYPSLYEGFGLPILEGFVAGVPVVTSNIGSMAEIAEGAAVLVDPLDVKSIVAGIQTAMKNHTSFTQKGKIIADKYSWETAARQTLNVYKELL